MECYNHNIWKRTRKKKSKRIASFIIVVVIFICICVYYKKFVVNNIFNVCEDYIKTYSTITVNNAVLDCFTTDYTYNSLVNVEKNQNGDITLIELNTVNTNVINREISSKAQKSINEASKIGIPIKLGAFLGIDLLSGYGKEIVFNLHRESFIICKFNSTFKSCGINQTIHSVYLEVITTVNMEIPLSKKEVVLSTEVLLCEAVIVGKIPNVFLDSNVICN